MRHNAFRVSVPASSANLGPGFDAVAIALGLRMRASVRPARSFALHFGGTHAPSHDGLERIFLDALDRSGDRPAVSIQVDNEIPLGAGLGSSAAARVLALAISARARGERLDRQRIAGMASELEGHGDNAYAAAFGGAVITARSASITLEPPAGLHAIIAVPHVEFPTHAARALLPPHYSREDMAFTAARASLLGAALASGAWHALGEAMRDRLHQPYRAESVPGLRSALALRMPGLLGIALSGAGPSVLAFARPASVAAIGARLHACFTRAGLRASLLSPPFARHGIVVRGA